MTVRDAKSKGLSPTERENVLAAARKAEVKDGARAEADKAWEDVKDSEARGSEDKEGKAVIHEYEICRPSY